MAISNSTDRFNGVLASLAIKVPCVVVSILDLTLSGEQTVNGVAVVSGDRVLVNAQTNGVENGIYDASASAWVRAADWDGNRDAAERSIVLVGSSVSLENTFYQCDTAGTIVIGSTSVIFSAWVNPAAGGTLGDLDDIDLTGGVQYDLLFNADGTEWQPTAGLLSWNPDLGYLRLENDHGINWLTNVPGTSEFLVLDYTIPGAEGSPPATDPNLGSVVLLITGESPVAAPNATVFTSDIGSHVFTWSASAGIIPTQVNGHLSTGQSKFGSQSVYSKETGGAPSAGWEAPDSADFDYGTADFTIEFHCYIEDYTSAIPWISKWTFPQRSWRMFSEAANGRLSFEISSTGSDLIPILTQQSGIPTMNPGSWYHIAVTKAANSYQFWRDGLALGSPVVNATAIFSSSSVIELMAESGDAGTMEAYMDNIRITKGVARYTTTFTAPTEPFDGSDAVDVFIVGDPLFRTRIDGGRIELLSDTDVLGDLYVTNIVGLANAVNITDDTTVTGFIDASEPIVTRSDILTGTPPSTEAVVGGFEMWDSNITDQLMLLGYEGNNNLQVRNLMRGGPIVLGHYGSGGALRTAFHSNPDGITSFYNSGVTIMQTRNDGLTILGSLANGLGGVQDTYIILDGSSGTDLGRFGFVNSIDMTITSLNHGGLIIINAEDAGGVLRTILSADPDSETILRGATNIQVEMNNGAERVLRGEASGGAILYYANTRRFVTDVGSVNILSDIVTASPPTTEAVTGSLQIWDADQTDQLARIGYEASQLLQIRNLMHGGGMTLSGQDVGGVTRSLLASDPDGGVVLYRAGAQRFETMTDGVRIFGTDVVDPTTGGTHDAEFTIWNATPDLLGQVGFLNSSSLTLLSRSHGAIVELVGEDTAGVAKNLFRGDPNSASTMYHAGLTRLATVGNGVAAIRSDTNTDAEDRRLVFQHQDSTTRAYIGHAGDAVLGIRNQINSGHIAIYGNTAAGAQFEVFRGDPDLNTVVGANANVELQVASGETAILATANGGVNLYYNNNNRLVTYNNGTVAVRSTTSTDTENRLFQFEHQDATLRGLMGTLGDDVMRFENRIHGGNVQLRGEDVGGTARIFLEGNPDTTTILRGDTDVLIQVAAGTTAINAIASGRVDIYYNGQVNLRTSDESAADIGMGAEVRHNDDTFQPVGMNVIPPNTDLDSGNVTLSQATVGLALVYNTVTARSLLLNNDSAIKVGATWSVMVGPSAGALTGDGGTGVVIRWWNGSGWTDTAAAANITIGVGQYSVWKETDTLYWVNGPVLS